jgi:hypothetical protein
MQRIVLALTVAFVAGQLHAGDEVRIPAKLPPQWAVAKLEKGGHLTLRYATTVYVPKVEKPSSMARNKRGPFTCRCVRKSKCELM